MEDGNVTRKGSPFPADASINSLISAYGIEPPEHARSFFYFSYERRGHLRSEGTRTSRAGDARVTDSSVRKGYSVYRSDKQTWKREVGMQIQWVVLTIGLVWGLVILGRLLVRFVSVYRYRKLVNDRLEKLALDMRIQNACC